MKKENRKYRKIIIEVISMLYILLFVYAASSKLMDYTRFRVELGKSPLLTAFAGRVAWWIPRAEIVIAVMLAFKRLRLAGLYAAFTLMVMFTTYIIVILNFSFYVPCTCGGVLEQLSWGQHIVFNAAFILLGLAAILMYEREPFTLDITASKLFISVKKESRNLKQ